jgi:hypothetical protein
MGALSLAVACVDVASPEPSETRLAGKTPEVPATAALYSPFVVQVRGEAPFREITFKQVGSISNDVDRARLFETLAESLALDLAQSEADWSVATNYSPEVAEPAFHRACGAAHIYVDFWERGGGEPGWGYSLWSGCSMDDRFALEDVAASRSDEVTDWVAPLTERIARSIEHAHATSCFRAEC